MNRMDAPGSRSPRDAADAHRRAASQSEALLLEVPEGLNRMSDTELERWLGSVLKRYGMDQTQEGPIPH